MLSFSPLQVNDKKLSPVQSVSSIHSISDSAEPLTAKFPTFLIRLDLHTKGTMNSAIWLG